MENVDTMLNFGGVFSWHICRATSPSMAVIFVETETERVLMMFITGMSNLPGIYPLLTVYRVQSSFHQFIGWFTMTISFCYHCTEALPSQEFILHEGNWHRLDNVGAVTSFTLLMIYLMDISRYPRLRAFFELFQFGITLLIQERAPWNLENTLVPILFWTVICVLKHIGCYLIYGSTPNYQWRNFKIGGTILLFGSIFFGLGLDDDNDYLRIYHAAWHLCATVSSYWMWKIVKTENVQSTTGIHHHDKRRHQLWILNVRLFTCWSYHECNTHFFGLQ